MVIKVTQIILIALAFIIPIFGNLTIDSNTVFKNEHRTAFSYPSFTSNKLTRILDLATLKDLHDFNFDDLQKPLNDRLIGREYFQTLFSTHQSLMPTTVHDFDPTGSFAVLGSRKGWYFTGDMRYAAYKKHIEDVQLNLENTAHHINFLKKVQALTHAKTYLVVGPDKHSIYSEFMNQNYGHPGHYRYFDKIKPIYEYAGIKIIDNFDALKKAKDLSYKTTLYLANDSHWNEQGAKIAFDNTLHTIIDSILNKNLAENYLPITYNFTYQKQLIGDLTRDIFNADDKQELDKATSHSTQTGTFYFKALDTGEEITTMRTFGSKSTIRCQVTPDTCNYLYSRNESFKSKLKVALVTDSYGHKFQPYLFDYFHESMWLNALKDDEEIIEHLQEFKPDLVLYLRVERNL